MTTVDKRVLQPDVLSKLRRTILKLFSEKQYHEVGIRDICQAAQVSPKTVYKYFGNKESLLLACIEEDLGRLNEDAFERLHQAQGLKDKFYALTRAYYDFFAANPVIARIVFLNIPTAYWVDRQSPSQAEFRQKLLELIQEGQNKNVILSEPAPEIILDLISGAGNRIVVRWLTEGSKDNLLERADQYFHLMSHMLDLK